MPLTYDFEIPPGGFITLGGQLRDLAERLALDVSDRAARNALRGIRSDMEGARLGKLGRAIAATSDKEKGRGVYRQGDVSRASGIVFIRSRSPRTVGAIISYTEGAQITAKNRSGYLWYPTENAQRVIGRGAERARLTPALWKQRGLDTKIGPLIRLRGTNGNPVLAVRNVGIGQVAGGRNRARSLTRSGRPRRGDTVAELVVMFIGIRSTSRAARVFPQRRAREAALQAVQELRGV
jgi:hypothetical protein